jgi:flotillin
MDLSMAIVPIFLLVLFVMVTFIWVVSRYKRCPSDKVLVVYGKVGKG